MTVTSGDGAGGCSLRQAITAASDGDSSTSCGPVAGSGPTSIAVPAGDYSVTAGELQVGASANIVITGANPNQPSQTVIDAGANSRVFEIASGAQVTLSALEVTGGLTTPGVDAGSPGQYGGSSANGGGILNHGALMLDHVLVTGNLTGRGGRGANGTPASTSARNGRGGGVSGSGAGIYNDSGAALTVQFSAISANATGPGGAGGNGARGQSGDGNTPKGGGAGNGNQSGDGGGIYNDGTATITNSTVSGNATGRGGDGGSGGDGADGDGDGTGENGGAGGGGGMTYDRNSGDYDLVVHGGGGIFNAGTLNMTTSTISGNDLGAGGNGGSSGNGGSKTGGGFAAGAQGGPGGGGELGAGVLSFGTGIDLTNATIAGNQTGEGGNGGGGPSAGACCGGGDGGYGGSGAGLFARAASGDHVDLTHVTVSDNSLGAGGSAGAPGTGGSSGPAGDGGQGAGIYTAEYDSGSAGVSEANTIVAGNVGDQNCRGSDIHDGGNDLTYPGTTCPGTSDDPKLGTLADNGGPTQTLLPGTGSAAIGGVPQASCTVSIDQRGYPRPGQGKSACDIGAVETGPAPSAASTSISLASSDDPSEPGGAVTYTATVSPVPDGGTMSFTDGGTAIPGCGQVALTDDGQATCPVNYSAAGSHSIAASYSGDTNFVGSTSPALNQDVQAGTGPEGAPGPVGGGSGGTGTGGVGSASGASGSGADGSSGTNANGRTALGHIAISGQHATIPITCTGPAGSSCSVKLTLSATETFVGSKLIALSARKHNKPKKHKKTVVLGTATITLAAGKTRNVRVTLNARGNALLVKAHKLKLSLVVTQSQRGHTTAVSKRTLNFEKKQPKRKKRTR